MKTQIENFTGSAPIGLSAGPHGKSGNLITIVQQSQGMRFQHDMTLDQAREMAAALVALADSFDEVAA